MEVLPEALKPFDAYKQFIVYVLRPRPNHPGKMDKWPVDPRTGEQKPKNWNSRASNIWTDSTTAISSAIALGPDHGVGFIFTEDDPFFFLDIDGCATADGDWSAIAKTLCSMLPGAAIEISSSRNGLHIFGCGKVPPHKSVNNLFNMEFYSHNHFAALTGFGASGNALTDCTEGLRLIIPQYFAPSIGVIPVDWSDEPRADWSGPIDDDELIAMAISKKSARSQISGHASFQDLWEANETKLAKTYPPNGNDIYNRSIADAALAQHLTFWTGNDCERILRLMRKSGLVRDKWQREQYLRTTIITACSKASAWLNVSPKAAVIPTPPGASIPRGEYLSVEQQKELFRGCVYILDEHGVLIPGGQILKPDQFKAYFGGYSFPMDLANAKVTRNAWEAFTESQILRKVFEESKINFAHSTAFYPSLPPGTITEREGLILANSYTDVKNPRVSGDAAPFLKHMEKLLTTERDRTILVSYLAACVQYPGVKFQWAPFIQGVDGNGKTLFTRCAAYAIGERYTQWPEASEIADKFDNWMYGSILIGVEDIYVAESQKEILEKLKPMITNTRRHIREMYKGKIMRDVCCNFIINSNHKDGIRKTRNDRRFAPFYCAQQIDTDLKRDGLTEGYFRRLYGWLERENGYAIVSDFLHTYVIPDEFNPANLEPAPVTSSTKEAIIASLGGVEQEVLEAIEQGTPGFKGGWISSIWFERLLERLNVARRIPINRRRELLISLGYDWHPGLIAGRVNNIIATEGGKPKLFIRHDHPAVYLTGPAEIAKAYLDAQNC